MGFGFLDYVSSVYHSCWSNHKHSSDVVDCENFRLFQSSRAMARGSNRYPEVKNPLRREVHVPPRTTRFGLPLCRSQSHHRRAEHNCIKTDAIVIDVDDELVDLKVISDDTSMNRKSSLTLNCPVTDVSSFEAYRKVVRSAENRTSKLKDRGLGGILKERCLALLRSLFSPWKQEEESLEDVVEREAFLHLSKEDEISVKRALSTNTWNVLVSHKNSNIDITEKNLSCLRPGEWLNDEVINLYLVLLKEREAREPKKFLKCHFFNTFFYTKLVNSGTGYNYDAVRRWTSIKKLGYDLINCDKIFIPIHRNIHWTLAVINIRDRKFQYLDSFKGKEPKVLDAVARYFVDEVKNKNEEVVDVSLWKHEFVQDLPMQKNGYDCGMFMLKYIDFYSRGLNLSFSEEHMPYFRVRTAKEILQLKAD